MPTRAGQPFLGNFPSVIDDKGRLSIPADFRHAMPPESEGFIVLTPGSGNFLNAFPLSQFNAVWEKADSDVLGFATSDSLARDTALLSEAVSRQFDSQGRITLPQNLLKAAGIGREIVFMGRWNHFIIWDSRAYDEYRKTQGLTPGDAWKRLMDQNSRG